MAAVALVATAAMPGTSAEATSFRYWSYWTGGAEGWQFASVGPAFRAADEDTVEGWRLAVSDVQGTSRPRLDAGSLHDRACRDVPPHGGKLRIAVVIDFGTAEDALPGDRPPAMTIACAVVDEGATGFDALKASGALRTESGMVCGIDGYPSSGCGREAVSQPSQRPESPEAADRSPAPLTQPPTHTADPSRPEPIRNSEARSDVLSASTPSPSSPPHSSHSLTATSPSSPPTGSASPESPRATPTGGPGTVADAAGDAGDSASGGPLVAGLVLVGLVLLTVMGLLRARRRR